MKLLQLSSLAFERAARRTDRSRRVATIVDKGRNRDSGWVALSFVRCGGHPQPSESSSPPYSLAVVDLAVLCV